MLEKTGVPGGKSPRLSASNCRLYEVHCDIDESQI